MFSFLIYLVTLEMEHFANSKSPKFQQSKFYLLVFQLIHHNKSNDGPVIQLYEKLQLTCFTKSNQAFLQDTLFSFTPFISVHKARSDSNFQPPCNLSNSSLSLACLQFPLNLDHCFSLLAVYWNHPENFKKQKQKKPLMSGSTTRFNYLGCSLGTR